MHNKFALITLLLLFGSFAFEFSVSDMLCYTHCVNGSLIKECYANVTNGSNTTQYVFTSRIPTCQPHNSNYVSIIVIVALIASLFALSRIIKVRK